ncbi:MAG: thioredoxin-disulfide reductase [Ignavibacteria bacterium 13_1_40CM_2_61_4]|nr:MAG: thioredoxin-disulfide reductase [Ignavibacteria bacterium 13_1_40CM_2_61_4]
MENHHRIIIIGSGPAGLTAALYAGRANLHPLVFEGIQPGGQLTITTDVENYPGFPEGILGPEMMDAFRKQAQHFNAKTLFQDVTKVDFSVRPFRIHSNGEEYRADAVIIATGASAKWLGLPSEKEYTGYGVSACATCDAFFFRGLEVVVVGGGDTAIEEASFLTKFASRVTLVHRRDKLRASKIMQDRAMKNPKISFVWESTVEEVIGVQEKGRRKVTGIKIRNLKTKEVKPFRTDGLFIGIGHEPNTKIFAGKLDMTPGGYIVVKLPSTATSVPGVFAAGDVADPTYRQAVTAAGTGCIAALDAERFLESQHT